MKGIAIKCVTVYMGSSKNLYLVMLQRMNKVQKRLDFVVNYFIIQLVENYEKMQSITLVRMKSFLNMLLYEGQMQALSTG